MLNSLGAGSVMALARAMYRSVYGVSISLLCHIANLGRSIATLIIAVFFINMASAPAFAQPTPGTMEFGSSTVDLRAARNPSVRSSDSALLNGLDVQAFTSQNSVLRFQAVDAAFSIYSSSDAALFVGPVGFTNVSGVRFDAATGEEFAISSFALEFNTSNSVTAQAFRISGYRDGTLVGTKITGAITELSESTINLTSGISGFSKTLFRSSK